MLLFKSRLVCLPPLSFALVDTSLIAMAVYAPQIHDDGGVPPWFDGSRPPHGRDRYSFLSCPHCGKPPIAQVVLTPPAPFSLALPNSMMDIMWPKSLSQFYLSRLCSLK